MTTTPAFLLLDLASGGMDGWYYSEALARGVLTYRREQGPSRWILLRAVDALSFPEAHVVETVP